MRAMYNHCGLWFNKSAMMKNKFENYFLIEKEVVFSIKPKPKVGSHSDRKPNDTAYIIYKATFS